MKRHLPLFAFLALLAPPAAVDPDYSLVPRVGPRLFRVHGQNPDGRVSVGTGVMVAPQVIATNCHVTREAVAIHVWSGGRRWEATGQQGDPTLDICLLVVPDAADLTVPLAEASPKPGEGVLGIGYSGGIEVRFGFGEVRALHRMGGGEVIQSNAIFASGASGGGLFNERGELAGLVTFRHAGHAKSVYHFSVPAAWIGAQIDARREIGIPIANPAPAFWERPLPDQPRFLRAVALEAEEDWTGLAAFATDWTVAEPASPGAWRALAIARLRAGEARGAVEASSRAVALVPDDPYLWQAREAACRAAGDADCRAEAATRLEGFGPRFAAGAESR